jgi:SNF2 family DNA or RNA helicase
MFFVLHLGFAFSGQFMPATFKLVFSLFAHPVLGVLPEPYLVRLLDNGNLSLSYQKVAEENIADFLPEVSKHELALIQVLQKMSQSQLGKILKVNPSQVEAQLLKLSEGKDVRSRPLFELALQKCSEVKLKFFSLLNGSEALFETSRDGYPAGKALKYKPELEVKLIYQFHSEGISISPTIAGRDKPLYHLVVLDENTPVILAGAYLLRLPNGIRPNRFKPFAQKDKIEVLTKFAPEYIKKILIPDLQSGIAELRGDFSLEPIPYRHCDVYFEFHFEGSQLNLFTGSDSAKLKLPPTMEIRFRHYYGKWEGRQLLESGSWAYTEENGTTVFHWIRRDLEKEKRIEKELSQLFKVEWKDGEVKIPFPHFRDTILPHLPIQSEEIQIRFSPEFNQLMLKKARLKVQLLEKIDYFQVEGTIDWGEEMMELLKMRSGFLMEQGWVKAGDKYIWLEDDEQAFLQQLMLISSGQKEMLVPRNTLKAIAGNQESDFSTVWNRFTSLLGQEAENLAPNFAELSPRFPLREYQEKGVEWFMYLSANKLGGILADDMGLGKTFQTAAFLRYLRLNAASEGPTCSLVVLPSTLLFNWQYELKRFSDDFRVYVHSGPQRSQDLVTVHGYYNVILVSFQTLVRDAQAFSRLRFQALIVDEAHHVKNPGTAAYKSIRNLHAQHVFLLTGTPIQNSPADLWALSELCNPGLLSQKIKPVSLQRIDNVTRFQANMQLLQALVKPFLLRRTKAHVLSELPEKTVSILHCNMTEEQEMEYLAHNQLVASELGDMHMHNASARSVRVLKALTALRLLANHPRLLNGEFTGSSGKFDLVKEKLDEVLEEGHKVLIFSSFVMHLNLMADYLKEQAIPFAMLTGQTHNRKDVVDQFRNDAQCNVFLISLKAGGVGLNLVEASYVFLLDPWWNPAAEAQAMDRVYRIGQKNKVTVYKFITTNTVEEKILQLQDRKTGFTEQVFGEEVAEAGLLNLEALQDILLSNRE